MKSAVLTLALLSQSAALAHVDHDLSEREPSCVVASPAYPATPEVLRELRAGLRSGMASLTPEARHVVLERQADRMKATGPGNAVTSRKDAAGNTIIRVLFWYGPGHDSADKTSLEQEARTNLASVTSIFQNSGVKATFEFAGLERYSGSWAETVIPSDAYSSIRDFVLSLSRPSFFNPATGSSTTNPNYSVSVASLARNQANIGVGLYGQGLSRFTGAANLGGQASAQFDAYATTNGFLQTLPVLTMSGDALREELSIAATLAHEIGHLMGQQHGPDSDGQETLRAEMDYRNAGFRPYNNGYRSKPVAEVVTLMAYGKPPETVETAYLFSSPQLRDSKNRPIGDAKADNVKALNYDLEAFTIGTTPGVSAWTVNVVEYHCSKKNQYFMTALQANIDLLDQFGEAITCWRRTGETYTALSAWGTTSETVQPILRFFGTPDNGPGPNSHFYTMGTRPSYVRNTRGEEVTAGQAYVEGNIDFAASGDINSLLYLAAKNVMETNDTGPGLHFESVDLRAWPVTGSGSGKTCASSTVPVYRLYNNETGSRRRVDGTRIDGNHRYTTKLSIVNEMVAQGWANEGIAWCGHP